MKHTAKRILACAAAAALIFALTACAKKQSGPEAGRPTETETLSLPEYPTAAPSTEPVPDEPDPYALLQAYYNDNFDPAFSALAIRDFDGDGQIEMLVAAYSESATHMMAGYSLTCFRLSGAAVEQTDRFVLDPEEEEGFASPDESIVDPSLFTGAPDGSEELTVHVSDSGYIACLFYYRMNNWSISYRVFSVKGGKIATEKHLWDPGYSIGSGIYPYDSYFDNDPEMDTLFEMDPFDDAASGTYDSYLAALEGELGPYGFTWEPYHEEGEWDGVLCKGQIRPDSGAVQLLDFRNF